MSQILIPLLLVFGFLIMTPSAQGEADQGDYSRPGVYVQGGLGVAWSSSSSSFPQAPNEHWETDPEIAFALGWRENERLAFELEFEWIPSHEGIEYGNWLFGVNGKFFFMEEEIQPYVVIGANGLWAKPPGAASNQVDWGFRNGIGVDYYLNENWAVGIETSFVWGVGNVWKNYFLTTGLTTTYRF
ncbi:MAG: hypothetical protein CL917_07485 [Deltaproteobacteria bacterium]|nr:hypothetical protein [Deltaproteobacteria bacterium]